MRRLFLLVAFILVMTISVNAQKGTWHVGTTGLSIGNSVAESQFSPITGFAVGTTRATTHYMSYQEGGTVYRYAFITDYDVKSFGLSPEVSYFINDNIVAGLGLMFKHTSTKEKYSENKEKIAFTTLGVSPYLRYIFHTSGNLKMYAQFGGAYAKNEVNEDGGNVQCYWNVGVLPGISYNLSERFVINASYGFLGYESLEDDAMVSNVPESSGFGLNLNTNSLRFGFTIKI